MLPIKKLLITLILQKQCFYTVQSGNVSSIAGFWSFKFFSRGGNVFSNTAFITDAVS